MARRRTIGDNPLDLVVSQEAAGITESKKRPAKAKTKQRAAQRSASSGGAAVQPKQTRGSIASAGPMSDAREDEASRAPDSAIAASPASLVERVESLEQESRLMRWIVGAMVPLGVIALLL